MIANSGGKVRVFLVEPRGFCAGVRMAIETLERALTLFGSPLYVYHEIVHNQWVVSHFKSRGVIFVDDLEQVPPGSTLLYSAHGVAPAVRQHALARSLRTIDATCPLVTKVHREAVRLAERGFTIILIGHADHDEVVGTMGHAPQSIRLVSSIEEVDRLEVPDPEKVAYLTQTTLSVTDVQAIIERLRQRFPKIVGPPKGDVCYATQNRQEAVWAIAPLAQVTLVLGSQNSSNSRRLAEIAAAAGSRAYLIDGPEAIRPEWLAGTETVLVTAGASAPETLVEECIEYLRVNFGAEVELHAFKKENVHFSLPLEVR